MEILTVFLIAIGLSFDTFAVSASCGLILQQSKLRQSLKIAIVFAICQGIMPAFGWLVGSEIKQYVEAYDHWIAFILLFFIGLKMIIESLKKNNEKCFDPLKLKVLIGLGLATSIDALIIGISLAFLHLNIIFSLLIIASVTFLISILGLQIGKKAGNKFGKKMETIGGIILILIGIKIIIEHIFLS
jgi:putative Mn2+ efflux pump MntP